MFNFNDSIKNILEFTFNNQDLSIYEYSNYLKKFPLDFINIVNLDKNKIFINSNDELDDIFILVSGTAYVVNYTLEGKRIIADTLKSPQIFGLIEAAYNTSVYKATVITLTSSLLVKINKEDFLKSMYSDITTAGYIINYLSEFSIHTMKITEYKSAISPYDNLIIYLYNKAIGKSLPYKIKDNKTFIADSIHINKRTLYRYLNKLTQEGIISRDKQEVIISKENFKNIEKIFISLNEKT